jgi:heme o synthase
MENNTLTLQTPPHLWRAYLEMCKPSVVTLMLLTALIGMCLSTDAIVPWQSMLLGLTGIAFVSAAAAVMNHLIDRRIDEVMKRTHHRPLPTQQIKPWQALLFSLGLMLIGMIILWFYVNHLTALLTLASMLAYAVVYTVFLKHATPQNIVIGGIAGAMPPLLGWTAITNHVDPHSLLLVLVIFIWTPPHFWALAIHRVDDYKKANIPMLPITHGIPYTCLHILLYTILLFVVSLLPYLVGMSGLIYCIGTITLGGIFLYWAVKLFRDRNPNTALKTFKFSIYYLMLLFFVLMFDHYLRIYFI